MAKPEKHSFSAPHEARNVPNGKIEIVNVGGLTLGRATFQPGWKWSKDLQPIAKTKSCQMPHLSFQVSGVLRVKMDDGTEQEIRPGEVALIPPGHDAWVVGDEPVVSIDIQGMKDYAKPGAKPAGKR
ncbi:MAG: cupin domain-containing protein [Euryarchaeota archaeon]|nr:cupin domain-containing protein [Euryarchaeota archaeon]MDE1836793.1 cupin domain-containing protein [Euryarchaeota archaeon]MDE1881110.1 cupin domain-containing protein [Euryarchaeota archaeon]MDE2044777.1 cupin domain-containing protein [Thermoplasmata archaeon]